MSSNASFLRAVRLVHLYLGVFSAPALLFFAFTGAIQTFSLHETTKGSDYKPPRALVILGQIHKKQTPIVPARKSAPEPPPTPQSDTKAATPPAQPSEDPAARAHNPLPLKLFFLTIAISLFLSTLTGIVMAYKYHRNQRILTSLLILGTVLPILLVLL